MTTSGTGCDVSWEKDDITFAAGTYTASIDISFNDPSLTNENVQFDITVSPCVISTWVESASDQTYMDDGTTGTQFITAYDSSSCGYVPTCSSDAGNPTWVDVKT